MTVTSLPYNKISGQEFRFEYEETSSGVNGALHFLVEGVGALPITVLSQPGIPLLGDPLPGAPTATCRSRAIVMSLDTPSGSRSVVKCSYSTSSSTSGGGFEPPEPILNDRHFRFRTGTDQVEIIETVDNAGLKAGVRLFAPAVVDVGTIDVVVSHYTNGFSGWNFFLNNILGRVNNNTWNTPNFQYGSSGLTFQPYQALAIGMSDEPVKTNLWRIDYIFRVAPQPLEPVSGAPTRSAFDAYEKAKSPTTGDPVGPVLWRQTRARAAFNTASIWGI